MSDHEDEVRRASIDPGRLLPGEDPTHPEPGDPEHWVEVYTQLLNTKRQLVRNLREMMERQSDDVRDELERADIRMLELQIQRFEARRAVWRAKMEDHTERDTPSTS
jgi:hypothetical protein